MAQSSFATQVPASFSFLWNTSAGRVATASAVASIGLFALRSDAMGLLVAVPTVALMAALALKNNCVNQ